jgi:Protein of unknown function (DUF3551)
MRNIVLAIIITTSAGLAMPALADDVAQCKQLGYKPGTALFLQCLTLYQQQRAQAPAAGNAEQAAVKPNWCLTYSYDGGTNCGFETYQECKGTASGGNGSCSPSPYSH